MPQSHRSRKRFLLWERPERNPQTAVRLAYTPTGRQGTLQSSVSLGSKAVLLDSCRPGS